MARRTGYRSNPHTTTSGGDAIWFTTRIAIYLRDGFTCYLCGRQVQLKKDASLDHIDPTWDNAPTNLITCCRSCNSSRKKQPLPSRLRKLAKRQAALPIDRETAKEVAFIVRPAHRKRSAK